MNTIYDCINMYIDSCDSNQAVLISGTWGCGKTFYIFNHLIRKWREDFKNPAIIPIYVSCFGIDTIQHLTAKIKSEYISETLKYRYEKRSKIGKFVFCNLEKIKRLIKYSNTFLKESYSIFKAISSGMKDIYADFIQVKSTKNTIPVIILDDFERTGIEETEILGLINDFTDRQKIKVIIVCNEEKQNGSYFIYKEKVVRQVFYYSPGYREILLSILSDNTNWSCTYSQFVWKMERRILSIFEEANCKNIRTMQKAISLFYPYFVHVYNYAEEEILQNDFLGVLLYMIYRDNLDDPQEFLGYYQNKESTKLNKVIISGGIEGKSFFVLSGGFSSDTKFMSYELSKWIIDSQFCKEKLISEIKKRSSDYEIEGSDYYRFTNGYFLEFTSNEQIESIIRECIDRMKRKKMSFLDIISLYSTEKHLLVSYNCTDWSQTIENAIVEYIEDDSNFSDILAYDRQYVYYGYNDSDPEIDKKIINRLREIEGILKGKSGIKQLRLNTDVKDVAGVAHYLLDSKTRLDDSLCKYFEENICKYNLKSIGIVKTYILLNLENHQYSDYSMFTSLADVIERYAKEQPFLLLQHVLLNLVIDMRKQIKNGILRNKATSEE